MAARFASGEGLHHALGGKPVLAVAVAVSLAFLLVYHALEIPRLQPLRARLLAAPAPLRGLVYGLVVVLLFTLVPVGGGTFIYAQF